MSLLFGPTGPVRTHEERQRAIVPRPVLPPRVREPRTSPAPMQQRPSGRRLAPVIDDVAVQRIQAAAAEHFGVDVAALVERHGPGSPVAHARRVAVAVAKEMTASSFSSLARKFGMSVAGTKNALQGVAKSPMLTAAAAIVRGKVGAP